jgi:hypothetical protein
MGHALRRAGVVLTLCLGGAYGLVAYNSGWLERTDPPDGVRTLRLVDMPGYTLATHPTPTLFFGQCRADDVLGPGSGMQTTAFGKPGGDLGEFAFETLVRSTAAPTLYQHIVERVTACHKQDAIAWTGTGRFDRPANFVPAGGPRIGNRSSWWVNTKADPDPTSISIMPGESLDSDPSRPRWVVLVLRGDTIMQVAAATQDEAARVAQLAVRG